MPMRLDDGWNQIQFNLADFTRRAYGTNYIETLKICVRKMVNKLICWFINLDSCKLSHKTCIFLRSSLFRG